MFMATLHTCLGIHAAKFPIFDSSLARKLAGCGNPVWRRQGSMGPWDANKAAENYPKERNTPKRPLGL